MKIKHLIAFALLFAGCLSGCGNSYKRDALVFYVWGDSSEISWYEKIADDFKKESGISVKVQPCTANYYENLNIMFSSQKSAPDVFFTEAGQIPAHIASKKILNLQPYIDDKALNVKTSANPEGDIELWSVNDAYRYDGNEIGQGDYYAIIKDWSPDFILWYNKNHIDQYNTSNGYVLGDANYMNYPSREIPMTWEEFLDMSFKLTIEEGGTIKRFGTMLDRVPYKHLMEFIQMTGSSTWTDDNKYFNNNDPNVKKAFEFFTELQIGEKRSAPKIGPGIDSGEAFANGNISFAFFGNWAYSSYGWDSIGFEFDCCPAPIPSKGRTLVKNDTYAGSCGMISLAVYNNSTMKDEAIAFLDYYMKEGNEYMARKGYNIPGNKIVANSEVYQSSEDLKLADINLFFLEIAQNYTHPIVYNKYIDQLTFEGICSKYISNYLDNPTGDTIQGVMNKIAEDLKRNLE